MALTAGGAQLVAGVGDCKIGRTPVNSLATYALGSCIAVVAWDWKLKLGGLLHVMLPDSSIDPVRARVNPWVCADTGVPALLKALIDGGSVKTQLRWCLIGGAAMMTDSAHFEIGKRNHLALKKVLWRLGVFIEKEDVGGTESRSVRLDLETGQVIVRKGCGGEQILAHGAMWFMKGGPDHVSAAR